MNNSKQMDIRQALHYLGEITGEITTDDLLANIFSNRAFGRGTRRRQAQCLMLREPQRDIDMRIYKIH